MLVGNVNDVVWWEWGTIVILKTHLSCGHAATGFDGTVTPVGVARRRAKDSTIKQTQHTHQDCRAHVLNLVLYRC